MFENDAKIAPSEIGSPMDFNSIELMKSAHMGGQCTADTAYAKMEAGPNEGKVTTHIPINLGGVEVPAETTFTHTLHVRPSHDFDLQSLTGDLVRTAELPNDGGSVHVFSDVNGQATYKWAHLGKENVPQLCARMDGGPLIYYTSEVGQPPKQVLPEELTSPEFGPYAKLLNIELPPIHEIATEAAVTKFAGALDAMKDFI